MLGGFRVAGRATRVASTSVDDPAPIPLPIVSATPAARAADAALRVIRSMSWEVCVITAIAAALRLAELEDVGANQFYDAAVRSMSLSWHNFLFGAFDPGGFLSIDKPPLDLWLQVASVKLFGFSPAALKLPEALAGTLAVPLLYDALRRVVGKPAGLAAAMALAVLPESVLTSRSDTMDSVMMLLVVAALWLTIRASLSNERRWLLVAGVALGLAFNVKLLESLIAVPGLLVLYLVASEAGWRAKLRDISFAGLALVGVALSWAVVVSLAPGRHPYPVGSTDGTVWNVMFVFNGFSRVSTTLPQHRVGGPGVLRLFQSSPYHFEALFGCVLVAALAIGGVAFATSLVRRGHGRSTQRRLAIGLAVGLAVWIAVAMPTFDRITVLHARYLDTLAPALAAAIGYGAASLAGLLSPRDGDRSPSTLGVALALVWVCAFTFTLRPLSIAWGAVALAVAAVGAALLGRSEGSAGHAAKWLTVGLITATAIVFPIHESLLLVRTNKSDSMGLAIHAPRTERALSSYLQPRSAGLRYELAVDEPLALAPLIITDQRPIIPLTSFQGRPAVSLARLKAAVQSGQVRYALIGTHRCNGTADHDAACVPAARWVRQHGTDVSLLAHVGHGDRLYLLLPF